MPCINIWWMPLNKSPLFAIHPFFFRIAETPFTCWLSHSYLAGVTTVSIWMSFKICQKCFYKRENNFTWFHWSSLLTFQFFSNVVSRKLKPSSNWQQTSSLTNLQCESLNKFLMFVIPLLFKIIETLLTCRTSPPYCSWAVVTSSKY